MGNTAPTLFISDLHLEDSRPETTQLFLDLLQGPAVKARALYILGDLFEAWIGDDATDETGRAVAEGICTLSAGGVEVYFMHGNRDFMVGDDFCRRCNMTLLAQPQVIPLHGEPTLITHGDELCTDDVAYQRFRRKVRNPVWRNKMLRRPVWQRKLYARIARAFSRRHTAATPETIMDVNAQAVQNTFSRFGVNRIIHGHTHRPAVHDLELDGTACQRIVLGDWHAQGSVLEVTDEDTKLRPFDPR